MTAAANGRVGATMMDDSTVATAGDGPAGSQPQLAVDPVQLADDLVADEQALRDPSLTLQQGIATALQHLGTGFVAHPDNSTLRETLAASTASDHDLHRALLRIAYRLIVLFVAEDRDLLHPAAVDPATRDLYARYFSTVRLRTMAANHTGGRHTDLWEAHQIVTDALAGDGLATLGLSGLGATLFSRDALAILDGARLPNRSFLAAIKALSQIDDPVTGTPPVDYRNLDSEELGGMYEGLLAYTPRYHADERTFTLDTASGHDRKTSGSYYTPSDLIALVLEEPWTR